MESGIQPPSTIQGPNVDAGKLCMPDGFVLGKRSVPIAFARRLCGKEAFLGASIHSLAGAEVAVQQGADLLFAGTIFASASHPGEEPQGLSLLRQIKTSLPQTPVLAIGGITEENAFQVLEAGADGIAVISAILASKNIPETVERLCSILALTKGKEVKR